MGRPFDVNPQGIVKDGKPIKLNGLVQCPIAVIKLENQGAAEKSVSQIEGTADTITGQ